MYVTLALNISKLKNGEYSYSVSSEQYEQLLIGSQVIVNVNNQLKLGTVIRKGKESNFDFKIKPILAIYQTRPLNQYQAKLAHHFKQHSFASLLDIQSLFTEKVSDTQIDIEYYDQGKLVGSYKRNKELRNKQLEQVVVIAEDDSPKLYSYVEINDESEYQPTEKQQMVIAYLDSHGESLISDIVTDLGITRGVVNTLIKHQKLTRTDKPKQFKTLFELEWQQANELSPIQQLASDTISESDNQSLLFGVSSSGKTEVYIDQIKRNQKLGKQSLIIVPSVMLAVQVVGKLQQQFPGVIIYHRDLTNGQKHGYREQMKDVNDLVVVGTIESVLLPFSNLGLVVFDEAHERTYRIGRNINLDRVEISSGLESCGIKVILGTATPRIDDYARAERGVYQLATIANRHGNSNLPQVEFCPVPKAGISEKLAEVITINKMRSKPTLIFFNQNGYSSQVMCLECYHLHICPNCQKPLVYSQKHNRLECKYDGYKVTFERKCKRCSSSNLNLVGIGIEQFTEQVKSSYPEMRVVAVDRKMRQAELYQTMIDYAAGDIDILIGTKTIAFGIDFLGIDNVYVVNIDNLLTMNEAIAHEKVYCLLEQIVGRAGRNLEYSKAYIETNFSKHYVMQAVANHDYRQFYNPEMNLRKGAKLFPYYNICKVEILAENERKLINIGNRFKRLLERECNDVSEMLTPYIEKRYNKSRRYLLIKYKREDIKAIITANSQILTENNIDFIVDLKNQEIGV